MSYGSTPPPPPPPGGGGYSPPPSDGGFGAAPPPAGGSFNAGGPPPNNNLVLAILSTVLCCIATGIYAIVQSTKVNTLWAQGDFDGARKAAADAKKWSIIGAVLGLVGGGLYLIFVFVIAANTGTSVR